MLIAKQLPVALLGVPSKKGNIYDISLFSGFGDNINIYSDMAFIGSQRHLLGSIYNHQLHNGNIAVDVLLYDWSIKYYDDLVHYNKFIRMYLVSDYPFDDTINTLKVIAAYVSSEPAWSDFEVHN